MPICEWLVSPLSFKTYLFSENINESPDNGIQGGGAMKYSDLDSGGWGDLGQEFDAVGD